MPARVGVDEGATCSGPRQTLPAKPGAASCTAPPQFVFVTECAAGRRLQGGRRRFRWYVAVPEPAPGGCAQMPMVVGTRVVASTTVLTALDAVTGAQLWSTPSDGGELLSPAAAYGRIYAVAPTA